MAWVSCQSHEGADFSEDATRLQLNRTRPARISNLETEAHRTRDRRRHSARRRRSRCARNSVGAGETLDSIRHHRFTRPPHGVRSRHAFLQHSSSRRDFRILFA